jgi:hypothetical protein
VVDNVAVPRRGLVKRGDEPVPAAMTRLDEARLLRIILERAAQLLNARG